ncbi:hypothetical protein [Nannocystis pusilla]|uniref:hypothetical protein n=1 Tax=Nannocystis pusilla TaxID=889268 RepID=UPI003DA2F50F
MHRRDFALGLVAAGTWACGDRPTSAPPPPRRALAPEPEPELPSPGPPPPPVANSALGPPLVTRAALDARADALRERHVGRGFTVLVEPPFVVIGDEPPADVQRRADRTIHWSVLRLKQDYFARDPARIIDVYLFADRASYGRNTRELFGEEPDTPYGYYSPRHAALIMNIGTGGGTLVHEIVHPFMAANFPACPAWFNEGLASLYEQCGEHGGRIVGYPNWRLPQLQAAIRARRLRSFAELCATDSDEILRRALRPQLRPGPLPLLLFTGAGSPARLLSRLRRRRRPRSRRLRHPAEARRPPRHAPLRARVAALRPRPAVELSRAATARPPPRPPPSSP